MSDIAKTPPGFVSEALRKRFVPDGIVGGDQTYAEVVASAGLVAGSFDEIDLGYTGTDLTTVTYKLGGSPVVTLTLGYDAPGGNLISVTRS